MESNTAALGNSYECNIPIGQLKRGLGSTCHVTRRKRESGEFLLSSRGKQVVYFWRLFRNNLTKYFERKKIHSHQLFVWHGNKIWKGKAFESRNMQYQCPVLSRKRWNFPITSLILHFIIRSLESSRRKKKNIFKLFSEESAVDDRRTNIKSIAILSRMKKIVLIWNNQRITQICFKKREWRIQRSENG